MSEGTGDRFTRSIALEKAMKLYENSPTVVHPDSVVKAAEIFRKFLEGGSVNIRIVPDVSQFQVFELPREWDGYVYFLFGEAILYRSDTSFGSGAEGGIQRINLRHETKWREVTTVHLNTRDKLRGKDGYPQVGATRAQEVCSRFLPSNLLFR